ncbi:MAG: hypothetical protein LCH76_11440 [Actinobacteria bacterium]|nr:hypothetical protein [Actinomycetota bacterium]
MTVIRKIIAASVAASAIALTVGAAQATAAPVVKSTKTVVALGGGQGNWPLAR